LGVLLFDQPLPAMALAATPVLLLHCSRDPIPDPEFTAL
jgi:predicted esterase